MNGDLEIRRNSAGAIVAIILLFSVVYAITSYYILGPVPWKDFPFFILNKGFSMGTFILLTFNFGFGPLRNLDTASVFRLT